MPPSTGPPTPSSCSRWCATSETLAAVTSPSLSDGRSRTLAEMLPADADALLNVIAATPDRIHRHPARDRPPPKPEPPRHFRACLVPRWAARGLGSHWTRTPPGNPCPTEAWSKSPRPTSRSSPCDAGVGTDGPLAGPAAGPPRGGNLPVRMGTPRPGASRTQPHRVAPRALRVRRMPVDSLGAALGPPHRQSPRRALPP